MDSQIRNFKDFLQLYNKITELCFSHCVDNFHNRTISEDEGLCVDKCLQKFTRVNQRVMNVYVDVQTEINQRRVVELEQLTQEQQAKISATLGTNESSQSTANTAAIEIATGDSANQLNSSLDIQSQSVNASTVA